MSSSSSLEVARSPSEQTSLGSGVSALALASTLISTLALASTSTLNSDSDSDPDPDSSTSRSLRGPAAESQSVYINYSNILKKDKPL